MLTGEQLFGSVVDVVGTAGPAPFEPSLRLGCLESGGVVKGLTARQQAILSYILDSIADKGRFPSFREIAREFRLSSVATVAQHLGALVDKGYLHRDGRKLTPAPRIRRDRGVPIVGRVAAGRPISAIEHLEGHLNWNTLSSRGRFAVQVQGDSMKDEGILDGDLVIVQPSETAQTGDLVVAYIGDEQEATVKRFHQKPDHIELRPANPDYRPIRVPAEDPYFRLAGRVVGMVRRF